MHVQCCALGFDTTVQHSHVLRAGGPRNHLCTGLRILEQTSRETKRPMEAEAHGSPASLEECPPGSGPWTHRALFSLPVVLSGGGLHPTQQPRGGPAAVGGRKAQDAADPGQAAEADGGRLPVAEAGGEILGEQP